MPPSGQIRTRSERVAALDLPPGQWERTWASLSRRDVHVRIALALLTAIAITIVIRGWNPPFPYRTGYTPSRDVMATVAFSEVDQEATIFERRRARSQVRYVYVHDPKPLVDLRNELRNKVIELVAKEKLADVDQQLWQSFQPTDDPESVTATENASEEEFQQFRAALTGEEKLQQFEKSLEIAFAPIEQRGILAELVEPYGKGDQDEIRVHPAGAAEPVEVVKVSDVLIGDGNVIHEALLREFPEHHVADHLFAWTKPRLAKAATLSLDRTAPVQWEMDQADKAVKPIEIEYQANQPAGQPPLARAGIPLDERTITLLRAEYQTAMAQRTLVERVVRATAVVAIIFAMFLLCGMYMRFRQRGPLASFGRLTAILILAVTVVALACLAAHDTWRGELIPLMLFGMILSIAYRQELALLLTGVLALILVFAVGHGLHEFLLLTGVTTTAILNTGRIRTRSKLIYVGLFAGLIAFLLEIGLGLIDDQPFGWQLLENAARYGLWAVMAGFLMTGLLPFVERAFGVLTDLSLLELGDVSHPLLQELIRRAPSTYNHSVTVGSISEAAADSIGARGLLVRVGAYFHDIGKMLKPGYFIENQGDKASAHDSLVPTMSSLVIVAHIKDGSDLARQHHLPQPIIDLIEQHHGTTRVGFFYEQASKKMASDPNGGQVDESSFRYPGPKPQTKEAAVLMLADAVESASRTLVDPAPARIERLVREVAEHRLHGGQFDDSGLTLRELRTIEKSMVKSLIANYHGRIKYPDQKMA